jgi:hypothetical protein
MTAVVARRISMNRRDTRSLAALLAAVLFLTLPTACQRGPDIQETVTRLQAEMAATPTDADNYMDRVLVLEDWWNDLTLRGRLRIHQIAALPIAEIRYPHRFTDRTPELVERIAKILAFVERHGDQNGRLVRVDETDLVVNEYATIVLEYTVGEIEIATGGSLRIGQIFSANRLQKLQNTEPAGDAHVTVGVESEATTEATTVPWRGIYNSMFSYDPAPALAVTGGTLERGDTVRITLGDRSGGGRGLRMMPHDTDAFRFVVEVDPTGDGVFMPADFVEVAIRGADPARLRAVVPSIVAPDEVFALRLAVEDRYRMPATFEGGTFTVRLDDEVMGELTVPPGSSEGRLDGLSIGREGGYRFDVTNADGTLTAASNPILIEVDPPLRVFWGELHGHSGLEDAIGKVARYYDYARDVAFLDFASLSGHDVALSAAAWEEIRRETAAANRPGSFVAYMGYEWTMLYQFGGHHNVFFKDDNGRYATIREAPVLPELYEKLKTLQAIDNVLVIPHAHEPGNWKISDGEIERLVEMYSMHGTFEYFGQRYLDQGFRVGLIAASDDHTGHPGNAPARISTRGGLAAVYAPRLDRDSIWAGLRNRATYASSGERPVVKLMVEGGRVGGELPIGATPAFSARVLGTAPIDHIDVIKNGAVDFSRDYLWPDEDDAPAVQIMFHSSSETPGDEVAPPQQTLAWRGWIELTNGRIDSITPLGVDHFSDLFTQVDDRRVWFSCNTRGDFDGLLIRLADAPADATVTVRLSEQPIRHSSGDSDLRGLVPITEAPPETAVHETAFRVRDLAETTARVDVGSDAVILARRIRADGEWDVAFDYRPAEPPQQDDYFYLRVIQIDGGAVWTSPIWIGAE